MRAAATRDAAQVGFYLVLSFPALLLLVVWGFSTVLADDSVGDQVVQAIVDVLPLHDAAARNQVEALLASVAAGAGALGWVGAVSLVYSASGAIGALRYAVNKAFGGPDTRPYVPGKALDVALTLVVAPTAVIALGLNLSAQLAALIGDRPWLHAVLQFVVTEILPLLLLYALLVGLFCLLPNPHARLSAAWKGALVALVGVLLLRFAGQISFALFGQSNAIYGTLGVLLAVMYSAYLSAIGVVYGAHVTAQAARPPDPPETRVGAEEGGPGEREPLLRTVVNALRGLFVRDGRGRR